MRNGTGNEEAEDVEKERRSRVKGSSSVHFDNDDNEDVRNHPKREGADYSELLLFLYDTLTCVSLDGIFHGNRRVTSKRDIQSSKQKTGYP